MRRIAIIHTHKSMDIVENILKRLPESWEKTVYARGSFESDKDYAEKLGKIRNTGASVKFFDDKMWNNPPKVYNLVTSENSGEFFGGFLHLVDDTVQIFGDAEKFVEKIEEMMSKLKQKSWLNTSCDMCNYVFSKYNPRVYMAVDEEECKKVFDTTLAWCSNANTFWMCFDTILAKKEDMEFCEDFPFPMYHIIEFLSRRRNTRKPGELYYMNLYPSVPEEMKVFRHLDPSDDYKPQNAEIAAQDKLFRERNYDFHADFNVDEIFEGVKKALCG